MDQVASAIESVKKTSVQNAEGMKQIEGDVWNLEQLGVDLKALVARYAPTEGLPVRRL